MWEKNRRPRFIPRSIRTFTGFNENRIPFTLKGPEWQHSVPGNFGFSLKNNVIDDVQLRSTNQVSTTETDDVRRARLLYQSRKRGNLENGILLSTFAAKYLNSMTHEQLIAYDSLINLPDNEWDIYYWITKTKEAPKYFQTDVLQLLQEHCQNNKNELRNEQPSLY